MGCGSSRIDRGSTVQIRLPRPCMHCTHGYSFKMHSIFLRAAYLVIRRMSSNTYHVTSVLRRIVKQLKSKYHSGYDGKGANQWRNPHDSPCVFDVALLPRAIPRPITVLQKSQNVHNPEPRAESGNWILKRWEFHVEPPSFRDSNFQRPLSVSVLDIVGSLNLMRLSLDNMQGSAARLNPYLHRCLSLLSTTHWNLQLRH